MENIQNKFDEENEQITQLESSQQIDFNPNNQIENNDDIQYEVENNFNNNNQIENNTTNTSFYQSILIQWFGDLDVVVQSDNENKEFMIGIIFSLIVGFPSMIFVCFFISFKHQNYYQREKKK